MKDFNPEESAQNYIKEFNLEITPEELFNQFEVILSVFHEFKIYLTETNQLKNFDGMYRSKKLKERRALFCKWYFNKFQEKPTKVLMMELSEMTFMAERTVQEDTFCK